MATPSVTTSTLDDQVQAAFDQVAYFALRSQPLFEMVADVRSTAQSHNGSSVKFTFLADLGQATTALTENADVTAQALTDSQIKLNYHLEDTKTFYGNQNKFRLYFINAHKRLEKRIKEKNDT